MIRDWGRLINLIKEPVSVYDRDLRIIEVNSAFCELFKKSYRDIIGMPCYELIHGNGKPPDTCPHIRALKTHSHEAGEVFCHSIGITFEVSVSPIFEDGEVVGTVHIMRDISAHKRKEQALIEAAERHRLLLKHLSDAVMVHYMGEIVFINDAGVSLVGASSSGEIIGRNIMDFVHDESKEAVRQRVKKVIEERVSLPPIEERLLRLDGSDFYAEVVASPVMYYGKPCIQVIVRDITEEKNAREELTKKSEELSVLYRVSSSISQTIEMDSLFMNVLDTVTSLDILNLQKKGGIMLIDGERMRLVSHLGHSEEFVSLHKDMKIGECLCGIALMTGEVIISRNSDTDNRHTIRYPDMKPHGHIIIPLKTKEETIGVLYLYTPPDVGIDKDKIRLLSIIADQIGIAIENSRLYEETKTFSLHDPLTGLANRRFMDIMLDRLLAEAKRFNKPFSIIMADIDNFKLYNDTYGHLEGDRLLKDIADILSSRTRAVDLVVRYGGEEFVILLSNTDVETAYKIAEERREHIKSQLNVTVSMGVTGYREGLDKYELIRTADSMLYKAKQDGKDRVEVGE
ncbi:MAG: hypothetical protein Fur0020_10400 [Thermodesulfovibrionia bacterium]